ncbi:glycoside hydrolase superfamily [Lipomyces orientalis]|uniref:Glycoside hydrolase superfamily n=1 Tax=Lipomyces orientalis TaxID=1233043 RepID=A0ACC3TGZ2_9ASCO
MDREGNLSPVDDLALPFTFVNLAEGWSFKQVDDDSLGTGWLPVKRVPSMVHQDLIHNQKLCDPFIGFNEIKQEWIASKSWIYRLDFSVPAVARHPNSRIVLAFDGLDTLAQVRLDGKTVLKSDNMFRSYRIDVTDTVKKNEHEMFRLEVELESALLRAREIKLEHPEHKWITFNGEPARMAVRKAQYHWGWDWGPRLMTVGIWKPVRLEIYSAKIADVRVDVDIAPDYESASVRASVQIESKTSDLTVEFFVRRNGKTLASSVDNVKDGTSAATLHIMRPALWMPAGYGSQNLYEMSTVLSHKGQQLCTDTKTFGLRKVELVQEPDAIGKSFYFRVNGVDVFCGGSCWIPADSILTNISPERYRAWIELLVTGNQKMVRVWGGGVYEHEAFYDACDELGVLVWQDFMFACGNYPCYPEMLDTVAAEAVCNVRRLRHHPSLVIFAGNNEDYQVQESNGLTYDFADKNEKHWLKTDFPARYIYEKLLPEVIATEAPSVPYHPGSPWGDGKVSFDPTVGDMHQWNVWHGTQEKYQIFDTLGGRFNSEFGMEAFPHLATIKAFITDHKDLYPQSHVLDFHNKADGHERRIATYLVENVRPVLDLPGYIHLTQLIQAEALTFGYRGWRKQWGENRRCGGALVWQFNDCWPTISWSICDYYLRRKPSYYALARVLAPIAVGVKREHHDWSVSHAREPAFSKWELWLVSSNVEDSTVDIELRFVSVETGKEIKSKIVKKGVVVKANCTTNVLAGSVDNVNEDRHVLAARVFVNNEVIARDMDWPQPLKYLPFPKRNVKVKIRGDQMHVIVDRPVKCLVFEEREGCHLSDSAIDLAPGDEQIVTVRGLKGDAEPLSWTYLGAGEQ